MPVLNYARTPWLVLDTGGNNGNECLNVRAWNLLLKTK